MERPFGILPAIACPTTIIFSGNDEVLCPALEDPASDSNGTAAKLNRELADVTGSLEHLNQEWAAVADAAT
jgi:hypothetical protein